MRPRPGLRWLHGFLGANWIINGAWMMFAPAHWYGTMPQATETGPLNQHFVRDYGSVFFLIGVAVVWALWHGAYSRALHAGVVSFFVIHALLHVWDVFAGRLGHHHWTSGFVLVMIPVVALAALLHPAAWQK